MVERQEHTDSVGVWVQNLTNRANLCYVITELQFLILSSLQPLTRGQSAMNCWFITFYQEFAVNLKINYAQAKEILRAN